MSLKYKNKGTVKKFPFMTESKFKTMAGGDFVGARWFTLVARWPVTMHTAWTSLKKNLWGTMENGERTRGAEELMGDTFLEFSNSSGGKWNKDKSKRGFRWWHINHRGVTSTTVVVYCKGDMNRDGCKKPHKKDPWAGRDYNGCFVHHKEERWHQQVLISAAFSRWNTQVLANRFDLTSISVQNQEKQPLRILRCRHMCITIVSMLFIVSLISRAHNINSKSMLNRGTWRELVKFTDITVDRGNATS